MTKLTTIVTAVLAFLATAVAANAGGYYYHHYGGWQRPLVVVRPQPRVYYVQPHVTVIQPENRHNDRLEGRVDRLENRVDTHDSHIGELWKNDTKRARSLAEVEADIRKLNCDRQAGGCQTSIAGTSGWTWGNDIPFWGWFLLVLSTIGGLTMLSFAVLGAFARGRPTEGGGGIGSKKSSRPEPAPTSEPVPASKKSEPSKAPSSTSANPNGQPTDSADGFYGGYKDENGVRHWTLFKSAPPDSKGRERGSSPWTGNPILRIKRDEHSQQYFDKNGHPPQM